MWLAGHPELASGVGNVGDCLGSRDQGVPNTHTRAAQAHSSILSLPRAGAVMSSPAQPSPPSAAGQEEPGWVSTGGIVPAPILSPCCCIAGAAMSARYTVLLHLHAGLCPMTVSVPLTRRGVGSIKTQVSPGCHLPKVSWEATCWTAVAYRLAYLLWKWKIWVLASPLAWRDSNTYLPLPKQVPQLQSYIIGCMWGTFHLYCWNWKLLLFSLSFCPKTVQPGMQRSIWRA